MHLKDVVEMVCSASVTELCDLLFLPRKVLVQKYRTIKKYDELCVFTGYHKYWEKRVRSQFPGQRKKQKEERKKRLQLLGEDIICRILGNSNRSEREQISDNWKKYREFVKKAQILLEQINRIISEKIGYDYMTETTRRELVSRMRIPVCPYCNRSYIQNIIVDGENRYTGDLDHFLPKSVFQLYALSVWNLIPTCKLCNQTFKGSRFIPLLNPLEAGFDADCFLNVEFHSLGQLLGKDNNFDVSWELDPFISADTREKIENNIQMFRLNEVYQYHKEELRLVLKRRQMLSSRRYVEEVKKLVGEEDLDEILLGIPEKPENLDKRILAKAKYDVVKRN